MSAARKLCTCDGTCATCTRRASRRRYYETHASEVKRRNADAKRKRIAKARGLPDPGPRHTVSDAVLDARALSLLQQEGLR